MGVYPKWKCRCIMHTGLLIFQQKEALISSKGQGSFSFRFFKLLLIWNRGFLYMARFQVSSDMNSDSRTMGRSNFLFSHAARHVKTRPRQIKNLNHHEHCTGPHYSHCTSHYTSSCSCFATHSRVNAPQSWVCCTCSDPS
jgi:hypothetical protein